MKKVVCLTAAVVLFAVVFCMFSCEQDTYLAEGELNGYEELNDYLPAQSQRRKEFNPCQLPLAPPPDTILPHAVEQPQIR